MANGPNHPWTCVGDDDQSIDGWRGATLDNLKRLPQDFPTLKIIKLEQNYRSTNAILRAANAVIGPNPKLFPKTLWSAPGEGEPVRVLACDHEEHEAERAVARTQALRAQGASWRDCAILYRANHQSRAFEGALRKAQIPYRVCGGTSFFDRAEIKDLCAWLRLLANEDDDPAFLRAATTPRRGAAAHAAPAAGGGADGGADQHPGRARAGPGRGHALDPARSQGAGVAARDAGRPQRGGCCRSSPTPMAMRRRWLRASRRSGA